MANSIAARGMSKGMFLALFLIPCILTYVIGWVSPLIGMATAGVGWMVLRGVMAVLYIWMAAASFFRGRANGTSWAVVLPLAGGVFDVFIPFLPFVPSVFNVIALLVGMREGKTGAGSQNAPTTGTMPCVLVLGAAATLIALQAAPARHDVPLFISGANSAGQQGFVRVVNHTDQAGTVTVLAHDDTGTAFGPEVISLGAWQATHFNANDLEMGNAGKGLSGVGSGTGDWRLQIESDLRLEVLAYVRTSDGFLTEIGGETRQPGAWHLVPIFNPGSNRRQVSKLRLANPGDVAASVDIVGVDDSGATSQASATIGPGRALTISARELESGAGLLDRAGLGNGAGKWRLHVAADRPISVMSLMETPTGHITNLAHSTSQSDPSLPEQIAPAGASSGFSLSNWPSYRIAYARGQLYVSLLRQNCCWNPGVVLNAQGRHVCTLLFEPYWSSDRVRGLTYVGEGWLYVSNASRNTIMAYNLRGVRDDGRTIDLPWAPYEIAFGQGRLFVVTWVDGEAEVRQLALDGQQAGTAFQLSPRNENPTGMAYWDGHIYVVDEEKEQVFVYSVASGERQQSMEFELDPGNDVPQGIEYANGRFYVPDTGDDWVYAYTPSGETVGTAQPHLVTLGSPALGASLLSE